MGRSITKSGDPSPAINTVPISPLLPPPLPGRLEGQGLGDTGEERVKEGGNPKGAWRRTVLSGNFFFSFVSDNKCSL